MTDLFCLNDAADHDPFELCSKLDCENMSPRAQHHYQLHCAFTANELR